MKGTLLLLLLVLAAALVSAKLGKRKIFTYEVTGRSFAALNQVQNEWTGVIYKAKLEYEQGLAAEEGVWGKISQLKFLEKGGALRDSWQDHADDSDQSQFKPIPLTNEAFEIIYQGDTIKEIRVSENVPEWEIKFIRSVVTQLQITRPASSLIPSSLNALPNGQEPYAVYRVMEESATDKCEVLYDISPVRIAEQNTKMQEMVKPASEWIQFTKSRNFSNCETRPVYHFGFPRTVDWEPATNQMGEFFSRSEVGKIVKSSMNGTILSAETTSTVILSPEIYNQQKGQVISQLNMTLYHIEYRFNVDITIRVDKKCRFVSISIGKWSWSLREKEELSSVSSSSSSSSSESLSSEEWHLVVPNMEGHPTNDKTAEIMIKLAEVLEKLESAELVDLSSKESLEYFGILTSMMQSMNYEQIRRLVDRYYPWQKADKTKARQWHNVRDAIANAGTGATFLTIRDLIRNKQISGEEAANIIAAQPNAVRVPTSMYIRTFFELLKEKEVSESIQLTTAAAFGFSNLVRKAVVDVRTAHNRFPVHAYGALALKDIKSVEEIYIPHFGEQLKTAVHDRNSQKVQLYIRVLGNIAHPKIISVFEPYIEGQVQPELSTLQRTLLVVSLQKLAKIYPKLGQSVLFKIYNNKREQYQVRVAAIYNLMETNLPIDVLQRMAIDAHTEKSQQVRSAIKTSIESAARLRGEWNVERRRRAAAAVNLLPADVQGIQLSRNNVVDYVLQGLNMGIQNEVSWIGSQDTLVPMGVIAKGAEYQNNMYSAAYKLTAMVSSFKDLHDFAESFAHSENTESAPQKNEYSFAEIKRILNIAQKHRAELEGNLLFKIGGNQRFWSFNSSLLTPSAVDVIELLGHLSLGQPIASQTRSIQRATTLKFPTNLGFDFIFEFTQSSVLSVHGKLSAANITAESIVLCPDVEAKYASQSQGRIQFSTYQDRLYVAGNDRTLSLTVPLAAQITVDLKSKKLQVELDLNNTQDQSLYTYTAEPFTAIKNQLSTQVVRNEPKYKAIHVREPHKLQKNITLKALGGLNLAVEGHSEKENAAMFENLFPSLSIAFPLAEKTIEPVNLKASWGASQIKSAIFSAAYDSPNKKAHNVNLKLNIIGERTIQHEASISVALGSPDSSVLVTGSTTEGDYELTLTATSKLPKGPQVNFNSAVNPQAQPDGKIKISYVVNQKSDKLCSGDVTVLLQRTQERVAQVNKLPQAMQCRAEMLKGNNNHYGCQNATYNAGMYDKYIIESHYSGLPETIRDFVSHSFGAVRYHWYPYISHSKSKKMDEEVIRAEVQYNPTLTKVNVKLETQAGEWNLDQVPVHKVARSVAVINPAYSVIQRVGFASLRQQWDPVCSVDESMMKTFDNCTHKFHPEEDKWSVLVMAEPNYLILQRMDAQQRRHIRATFKTQQAQKLVELTPKANGISVDVDGVSVTLQKGEPKIISNNNKTALIITLENAHRVTLWTEDVEITHDSQHSVIKMLKRTQVVGLCGDANQEPRDLFDPQGFPVSEEEFVDSWTLKAHKIHTDRLSQETPYHSNIVSEQDAGRANRRGLAILKTHYYDSSSPESRSSESSSESREGTHALHKRLMVIEHGEKHCFSIKPQPACKLNATVIRSSPREIDFVCVDKNSNSHHWKTLIQHGARPDFSAKGVPQKMSVRVPVACSK